MLTNRQQQLLNVIVDAFIDEAQPIGSNALLDRYQLNISSATIRNEMSQLEKLGYLLKPHHSSGRVPSNEGLMIYINDLMNFDMADQHELEWIQTIVNTFIEEPNLLWSTLADSIAHTTEQTTLITTELQQHPSITNVYITPLGTIHAVLIVVYSNQRILKSMIDLPRNIHIDSLPVISNIIQQGKQEDELHSNVEEYMQKMFIQHVSNEFNLVKWFTMLIQHEALNPLKQQNETIISGKDRLLNQMNEQNIESMKALLKIFETDELNEVSFHSTLDGVDVTFGSDFEETIEGISFVSTQVEWYEGYDTTIAIVGPMSMNYKEIIPMFRTISKLGL